MTSSARPLTSAGTLPTAAARSAAPSFTLTLVLTLPASAFAAASASAFAAASASAFAAAASAAESVPPSTVSPLVSGTANESGAGGRSPMAGA